MQWARAQMLGAPLLITLLGWLLGPWSNACGSLFSSLARPIANALVTLSRGVAQAGKSRRGLHRKALIAHCRTGGQR